MASDPSREQVDLELATRFFGVDPREFLDDGAAFVLEANSMVAIDSTHKENTVLLNSRSVQYFG